MPNSSHSPGGTGELFPDATLPTADGGSLTLGDFRPKRNLVMLMLGVGPLGPEVTHLLDALAAGRREVEAEDGKVLAVTVAPRAVADWRWPFPLLLDRDGALHGRVGAVDDAGQPAPALYVTDHFREIYGAMQPGERAWPTDASEVVQWLVFSNIQCPECGAPVWD